MTRYSMSRVCLNQHLIVIRLPGKHGDHVWLNTGLIAVIYIAGLSHLLYKLLLTWNLSTVINCIAFHVERIRAVAVSAARCAPCGEIKGCLNVGHIRVYCSEEELRCIILPDWLTAVAAMHDVGCKLVARGDAPTFTVMLIKIFPIMALD